MSESKAGRKRTVLTDDGEIQEIYDAPEESQSEPIYCSRCGASNAPDAHFCRKCGNSLVEQEAALLGVENYRTPAEKSKGKHGLTEARLDVQPAVVSSALGGLVQLSTMAGAGAMALAALAGGAAQSWIAAIALIAWFLIEAVRRGGRTGYSLFGALTSIATTGAVVAMVISAIAGGPALSWVGAVALFVWFLIEAVRGGTRNNIGPVGAMNTLLPVGFVTAIVIAAIAAGSANSWVGAAALAGWFLLESARMRTE